MKLDGLPKPKTANRTIAPAEEKTPVEKKIPKRKSRAREATKPVVTEPNLHQHARNTKRKKEFSLPEDVVRDFEVTASSRGYGPRKHSDFFMEVWQFWRSNNTN